MNALEWTKEDKGGFAIRKISMANGSIASIYQVSLSPKRTSWYTPFLDVKSAKKFGKMSIERKNWLKKLTLRKTEI